MCEKSQTSSPKKHSCPTIRVAHEVLNYEGGKKTRASKSIYWSPLNVRLKRLLSLKQAAWADFVVFSG